MSELNVRAEEGEGKEMVLVGADSRRDVGAILLVQRAVNDGAVLQGHLSSRGVDVG